MKKLLLLALATTISMSGWAQKRALEWEDVQGWNRITSQAISNDGNYVLVETQPWVGDGAVALYTASGEKINELERGSRPLFVGKENIIATISPSKTLVDSLKLAKKKELPQKQLSIFNIKSGEEQLIDSLKDIKSAPKGNEWVAYRTGKSGDLTITNLGGTTATFSDVEEYHFSREASFAVLNRYIKDSISQVIIFDAAKGEATTTLSLDKEAKSKALSVSEDGKAAYIIVGKDKSGRENKIYLYDGSSSKEISIEGVQPSWIVNENMRPTFAESKSRLFFGISPEYPVADTTILESNKPKVDVWIWNEPKLKTQQVVDLEADTKRAYQAVYDIDTKQVTQIATASLPDARLFAKSGDSDWALVETGVPYQMESMWTGDRRKDIYIKNIVSGEQKELFKGANISVRISPDEKYLYWYASQDSTWRAYSIVDERFTTLATCQTTELYNSSQNVPALPPAYGSAGWAEGDKLFYIYDKYDIWALDPTGTKEPLRITDGYKSNTTYRVLILDEEFESFATNEKLLLRTFDNGSKQSGFASVSINKPNSLKTLITGEYRYGVPTKAKNSNAIIFSRENFEEFPDLYLSDIDFKASPIKITEANPQQGEFLWGSVEPITWISLDGDTLQGNLFKPENFDPNKKYPMICNFYERDSDNLYSHRTPEVHRSSIDYHYYTSNGYVIFNPDIKYVDGYPGESCYNSLMPGVSKILEMGFVDPERIGAQGHSWGGYQTAYLATRTDMFAALESGAPVVNMISAYGGIRWASGLNRAFQYEHGQSRIGASPWETPSRYTENSPIYTMDKVNTPILIMHNDQDGHVPWWQGIEFFVALRRLEKPVWMLNYNGEPHWPTTAPNKFDFQTKMSEFFDHYLKGTTTPEWMISK